MSDKKRVEEMEFGGLQCKFTITPAQDGAPTPRPLVNLAINTRPDELRKYERKPYDRTYVTSVLDPAGSGRDIELIDPYSQELAIKAWQLMAEKLSAWCGDNEVLHHWNGTNAWEGANGYYSTNPMGKVNEEGIFAKMKEVLPESIEEAKEHIAKNPTAKTSEKRSR